MAYQLSLAQSRRLKRGHPSIRKGNRKTKASYWAHGHRFLFVFSVAVVIVAFALIFVWMNYQVVQAGYDIAGLHQEKAELLDLNQQLKLELANLTSLDRLERLAKKKLGLITPRPDQVKVIE